MVDSRVVFAIPLGEKGNLSPGEAGANAMYKPPADAGIRGCDVDHSYWVAT
nr:hypothetical protein [Kibdelosporangium sp. MJ126-NF4]CTQ97901.1 hypothetical protein [Kibdelosporangium sp. MJ126-NF4]